MYKNCKGFSLLEIMIALSILTFILCGTAPLLTTVYKERKTIQQQHISLELLYNNLHESIYNKMFEQTNEQIVKDGTTFQIEWLAAGQNETICCVSWKGKNNRQYKRCGASKHV